jgi:hypothetical protein
MLALTFTIASRCGGEKSRFLPEIQVFLDLKRKST